MTALATAKDASGAGEDRALLELRDLSIDFETERGTARVVDRLNYRIGHGETVGIVGESGCGKSVTARAVMGLVEAPGRIAEGEILYRHGDRVIDIARLDPKGRRIRELRGNAISMIFQEPMTSLNPVFSIGDQIAEAVLLHQSIGRRDAADKAVAMLDAVGIPSPRERARDFPHQLSGGMRQRAMIAMAMSCNPSLLIADEPTTALDVTIQAQVLDLMNKLRAEFHAAIMFITHDLGVIATMADQIRVMYLGRIVESGPVSTVFRQPLHPYTQGMMQSIPSLKGARKRRLRSIAGNVPSPLEAGPGCGFASRCPHVMDVCRKARPALVSEGGVRSVACFLHHARTEEAPHEG